MIFTIEDHRQTTSLRKSSTFVYFVPFVFKFFSSQFWKAKMNMP